MEREKLVTIQFTSTLYLLAVFCHSCVRSSLVDAFKYVETMNMRLSQGESGPLYKHKLLSSLFLKAEGQ